MYDVIIIGAGPAGISTSLYTTRANLKTLILDNNESSLKGAQMIENYYGFENGITGEELYQIGIKQAEKIGTEIKIEEVIDIEYINNSFKVLTEKQKYEAKNVVLATGIKKNKPKIENIQKFEGKGISYCAICDGFFYKNKDVAIIGNGNYAINEAKKLENVVKSITILTNGSSIQKDFNNEKIKNIINKKIKKIDGDKIVEEIVFNDDTKMKIDGIFIAQGTAKSDDFAKILGAQIINNNIKTDENMQTSVKGLYACGDCTGGTYQISKAVYEGMTAGISIIKNKED